MQNLAKTLWTAWAHSSLRHNQGDVSNNVLFTDIWWNYCTWLSFKLNCSALCKFNFLNVRDKVWVSIKFSVEFFRLQDTNLTSGTHKWKWKALGGLDLASDPTLFQYTCGLYVFLYFYSNVNTSFFVRTLLDTWQCVQSSTHANLMTSNVSWMCTQAKQTWTPNL